MNQEKDIFEMNFYILSEMIEDIVDTILPCKHRSWYVEKKLFKDHSYPEVLKVNIMNCRLNLFPESNENMECPFDYCYNCKKREKGDP